MQQLWSIRRLVANVCRSLDFLICSPEVVQKPGLTRLREWTVAKLWNNCGCPRTRWKNYRKMKKHRKKKGNYTKSAVQHLVPSCSCDKCNSVARRCVCVRGAGRETMSCKTKKKTPDTAFSKAPKQKIILLVSLPVFFKLLHRQNTKPTPKKASHQKFIQQYRNDNEEKQMTLYIFFSSVSAGIIYIYIYIYISLCI